MSNTADARARVSSAYETVLELFKQVTAEGIKSMQPAANAPGVHDLCGTHTHVRPWPFFVRHTCSLCARQHGLPARGMCIVTKWVRRVIRKGRSQPARCLLVEFCIPFNGLHKRTSWRLILLETALCTPCAWFLLHVQIGLLQIASTFIARPQTGKAKAHASMNCAQ